MGGVESLRGEGILCVRVCACVHATNWQCNCRIEIETSFVQHVKLPLNFHGGHQCLI